MKTIVHESFSKFIQDKNNTFIIDSETYNYFVSLDNKNFENFLNNLYWFDKIKLDNIKNKYSNNFLLYSQKRPYIKLRKTYDKQRKKIYEYKDNYFFYEIRPEGHILVFQLEKNEIEYLLNKKPFYVNKI